jgi:hypothetical protein
MSLQIQPTLDGIITVEVDNITANFLNVNGVANLNTINCGAINSNGIITTTQEAFTGSITVNGNVFSTSIQTTYVICQYIYGSGDITNAPYNLFTGNITCKDINSTTTGSFLDLKSTNITGNITSTGISAFSQLNSNTITGNITSTGNSVFNTLNTTSLTGNITSTGNSVFNTLSTGAITSSGAFTNGANTLSTGAISCSTLNTSGSITTNSNFTVNTGSATFINMQVGGVNKLQIAVNSTDCYYIGQNQHWYNGAFNTEYMSLTSSLFNINVNTSCPFLNSPLIYNTTFNGTTVNISTLNNGTTNTSGTITCNNLNSDANIKTNNYLVGMGVIGAFMLDINGGLFNIICSYYDYGRTAMSFKDDYYYVMPNYKVIVYPNANWTGTPFTLDNTNGSVMISSIKTPANSGNSCRLYYGGVEMQQAGLSY